MKGGNINHKELINRLSGYAWSTGSFGGGGLFHSNITENLEWNLENKTSYKKSCDLKDLVLQNKTVNACIP